MDRTQEIRERAYQIWIEAGQPIGREEEHWEQARRDVEGAATDADDSEADKESRLDETLKESFPGSDPSSESQPGGGITGPAA